MRLPATLPVLLLLPALAACHGNKPADSESFTPPLGMVLANDLYSPHGLMLIGEGQALSPGTIVKIRSHNQVTPISQRLLVYS